MRLVISLVIAHRGNSVWQDVGGKDGMGRQLRKWRNGLRLAREHRAISGVVYESSKIRI